MGFFDVPHSGYGTYFNPVMIFTFVGPDRLVILKERAKELEINYERWFVGEGTDLHESLNPGIVVYFPQYNCLRNADHMTDVPITDFEEFLLLLKRHPKNVGSLFVKTIDTVSRDQVVKYWEGQGYHLFKSIPTFDHELSIHVSKPAKMLVMHSNRRADENEREGYPVMTYEDFKIYMQ
jgi:hypothetical protein